MKYMNKYRRRNIGMMIGGVFGLVWIIFDFSIALLFALCLAVGWFVGYIMDNPGKIKKLTDKLPSYDQDEEE